MSQTGEIRIDKYLWAVRLFKTRSSATEACRNGRVSVAGQQAKPSRIVKNGDIITIRRMPVIFSFLVKEVSGSRLPAKLVPDYIEDMTPAEEKEKLISVRLTGSFGRRDRGTGRPTKRERREIDDLYDGLNDW